MSENGSIDWRSEYLVRVRRFTDEMLDSLDQASRGKDVDEKEARILRSNLLKAFRIWENASVDGQPDPRLEERLKQVEKRASAVKTGEA